MVDLKIHNIDLSLRGNITENLIWGLVLPFLLLIERSQFPI